MIRFSWIIVALPLISFFLIVFFGKRTPGGGAPIGIVAVAASFVLSLIVASHFIAGGSSHIDSFTWFSLGTFKLQISQNIDGLTATMFVIVTLVSLCVQIYSTGYMKDDVRYTWYFACLSLFTGSMLNLVIANDLIQLLVGWELVGICSYLLVGHWWEEKENSNAGIKAFITTKTGDIPFLFGIFTLIFATGTSSMSKVSGLAASGQIRPALLTAGALLLFGGAIGKSAQFPLHVWLPDAMAGPTPVSALIHAATMVAAGVYLVGRLFSVFVFAPSGVLTFVAVIGSITMVIAALLAMVQDDIKRVLAYSTVSQLAYMVSGLSLGVAGYTPGLFHLFTHAFFKALLFLAAGSVIHAVHSNNMSEMGGLRKPMPLTFWTFLIGAAALSGIPPLAGFWSKDEIISQAWKSGHYAVFVVTLATAVLTAFYMTRAVLLTFFGEYRGTAHPHESPVSMTGPMTLLAALSVVAGFLGPTHLFADWVHFGPLVREPVDYGFAAISLVGAAAGIVAGYGLYRRWREPDPLTNLGPAYVFIQRKYYLDDIYLRGVVRPIQYPLAADVDTVDRRVIDGAVNGIGLTARFAGGVLRYLQSGSVQRYAAILFAGVVILAVIFTTYFK
ncbi:MAG: NADH-quinone oxidoreductase subunit L [Actinomycetota bacterium]|nr:NADH-quinone oxidoreductase subunit L [Actinomycetota bacterium]